MHYLAEQRGAASEETPDDRGSTGIESIDPDDPRFKVME
jgi:hypothetical protein